MSLQGPETLPDARPEEKSLVSELRDAFGLGTYGLKRRDREGDQGGAGGSSSGRSMGDSPELSIGSQLGDFEILGELGRGGMGIVYRARQSSLDRQVALKILPGAAWRGVTALYRFRREAQAAARLNHANVVPIYAQGEHEGSYYYAMKLIEGISLDAVIQSRPDLLSSGIGLSTKVAVPPAADTSETMLVTRSETEPEKPFDQQEPKRVRRSLEDFRHIATLLAGVADGLAHAHDNGVVHRDIKPHNLILGEQQRLYIGDFGLAYLTSEPHLTTEGEIMGTPSYLSPEQISIKSGAVDHRTDVYSLGVTLYELITGRRPFEGETREQVLSAIREGQPQPPRQVDSHIPIDLETICLRTIEKEAEKRYQTASALADDLRRFAEGRPILSRRTSLVEKAAKWVKRHKAVTTACVAVLVALSVAAAWAIGAAAVRHREANRLLDIAYDRLVHLDYHQPELVEDSIEQAAALGADSVHLRLVRALANMGRYDQLAAIADLRAVLDREPDNIQALYLLAWAQWRERQYGESRDAFEQAEDLGGPQSAEGWFFRGLAVHFANDEEAIESYRNANALRAVRNDFFPQAVLHLARAHNQRMYSRREIGALDETELRLRQLIDNGHYGAYPYYLRSIACRLAGEIYEGSAGVRDEQSQQYYDQALMWAREGQRVDPEYERTVTAEAEYLEQIGLLEEALETRSRAIAVAGTKLEECEGYHYRWRLNYWLGHLDDAMGDVEFHGECIPDSPFYSHVYPALILAETGDRQAGLELAGALAKDSPSEPMMVLWSATCLRLLGAPDKATEVLSRHHDELDFSSGLQPPQTEEWMRALYAFCADREEYGALEGLIASSQTPWRLQGEADFHAGAKALACSRRDEASAYFSKTYRSFDGSMNYSFHAKLIFEKLQADRDWPDWIPAANGGELERSDDTES
ncbi:MAG: protein kinase [Phycisphaerales bacterium]|nr:MAG: protein kinase [Phycisphaerales bacterium]